MTYNDSELQMNTNLVLCIEEHDENNLLYPIDTRLFIGWDNETCEYYVRGKREDTRTSDFVPFALQCKTSSEVYEFIDFVMGENKMNITLYNYNNIDTLPITDLTYELFEGQMDRNYEISGFDDIRPKRSQFLRHLRMLKSTYS